MTELDPGAELTPEEHVQVIKQEYENGVPSLLLDLTQEDKDLIRKELDPYLMKDLSFTTLVVWKKPIGLEFRTQVSNVKVDSPQELENMILENTPGALEEVNVTFVKKETAVVTVPYRDQYKPAIGLFLQPWVVPHVEEMGGKSDRKQISPLGDRVEDLLKTVLENPDMYEINTMEEGSLLHKTREAGKKDGSMRVDRPEW